MKEIWKDVVGYEGYYKVSSSGRIYSVPRKVKIADRIFRNVGGKYLRSTYSDGYLVVGLSRNSKAKTCYVHRLVATAFVANIKNKAQINHINGIKTDNSKENLEWCTLQENITHAIKTGLYENSNNYIKSKRKLSDKDVFNIRSRYKAGEHQASIASSYDISQQSISRIILLKTYRDSVEI